MGNGNRIFAEAAMLGMKVEDSESKAISEMISRAAEASCDLPAYSGVLSAGVMTVDELREDEPFTFEEDGLLKASANYEEPYIKLPRVI